MRDLGAVPTVSGGYRQWAKGGIPAASVVGKERAKTESTTGAASLPSARAGGALQENK